MHPIVFLPLFIAILIAINACSVPKGGIVILEDTDGTGFTMDMKEWSSQNKCEMHLNKGDELRVEVSLEAGRIDMSITGKNGSEPYTGKDLEPFVFNVAVSETDTYVIRVAGKKATGKVIVKNVSLP